MSRINLNIVATGDFSNILSEINTLRAKVADLNAQIAKTGGISDSQITAVKSAVQAYDSLVNSSGAFNRTIVDVQDNTAKFGRELQDGKLKVNEYFKVWRQGAQQAQGSLRELAKQQVALQQSVMRTDPFRPGKVFVDTPRQLDEIANKTAIARKELELYNLSLKKGGDALINAGKNTQWAGRQLTVGLTVPIAMFGQKAAQAFMDMDKELTRVTKVYGSGLNAASDATLSKIRTQVIELSQQIAQQLGVPIQETAAVAADLAATGLEGKGLINATTEAVRLSVLGEIDRQEAVRATVSLQNVFKLSTEGLTESINFLNAVENQTSTGLQDLVEAIPKASPVVAQLGGSFKDVAVMMVAMKEAGVPAAESANAIKSAVGSLINPTQKATENLSRFGINLEDIVSQNRNNLPQLFQVFEKELSKLSDLQRSQIIEEIFGKYQFARISALMENIGKEGSQTQQVFELMGASAAQTAKLADSELKQLTESSSGRYQRALADFQAKIAPLGEKFVEFGTKALNFFSGLADFVNNNPIVKNILTWGAAFVAIIGPIIMLGGVLGNFIGYLIKGFAVLKNFKDGFKGFTDIATPATVAAANAGELFQNSLVNQSEAANILKLAIKDLNRELSQYQNLAGRGGGPFGPGGGGGRNPLYPSGYPRPPYTPKPTTVVTGPGGPKADVIPAMLSAGEAVLNAEAVRNLTPDRVRAINNDPKLAAAMNRLLGVFVKYNPDTPVPYDPFTYTSETINKKTGQVRTPAHVIEGSGARQSPQGVGFAPYYSGNQSGGLGADIYHTESFASIIKALGLSPEEMAALTGTGKAKRKTALGRVIERYTPPSGVISTKQSIPSKIQQQAQDAPQHYYEPTEEDLKQMAADGIRIDPDVIKQAREKYIVGLAQGSEEREKNIKEIMADMTDQDAKDWFSRGQLESKATAAVLQEHLHNVLTGKETYNGETGRDAAKKLEKEMQDAASHGSPAKIDKLVSDLGLGQRVASRVTEVEKIYNDEVKKQLSSVPAAQRTPEVVSKAFQQAAQEVDKNLDRGYIDRLKTFMKEKIGGRNLFKVISGIKRSGTDTEFSGTVSGIQKDLNYSVQKLYKITGDKATGVEKAIDSYANAVRSASSIENETQRNAAIKQATVDLKNSLGKLGLTAEQKVDEIELIIRSATAQLAGVVPGTALGQGLRTAAGAPPAPTVPKVKKADGGSVNGPGTGTSDSIPAMLSNGEYVISAGAVKKYGTGMFDAINAKKFADGGMVDAEGYSMGGPIGYDGGGPVDLAAQKAALEEELINARDTAAMFKELSMEIEKAASESIEGFKQFEHAMNGWSEYSEKVKDIEKLIADVNDQMSASPAQVPIPPPAQPTGPPLQPPGPNLPSPTGAPLQPPKTNIDIANVDAMKGGQEYADYLDDVEKKSKEFRLENEKVSESVDKAEKKQGKLGAGLKKLGGHMKMGSMASVGLGMGIATLGTVLGTMDNEAAKAGSTIAQFAGMGQMFGPWGAAVGAAAGAVKVLNDTINENIRIQQNQWKRTFSLSAEEANFFGKTIDKVSDSSLTNLVGSTEEAKSKVQELAKVYSESADPATQDFIRSIRDADPATATNILVEKYKSGIIQGLSEIDSQQIVAALEEATGKTNLTLDVKARITLLKDMSPEEMFGEQMKTGFSNYFNNIGVYNADQYKAGIKKTLDDTPMSFVSGLGAALMGGIQDLKEKIPKDFTEGLLEGLGISGNADLLGPILGSIPAGFDAAAAAVGPLGEQIMAAFQSQDIQTFGNELDNINLDRVTSSTAALALSVKQTGIEASNATPELLKINGLDTAQGLDDAANAGIFFKTAVEKIRVESPLMAAEIENSAKETGNMKNSLLAAQAVMKGVIGTQDDVKLAFRNPVYLQFLIEKKTYEAEVDKAVKGAQGMIGTQQPIKMPVDLEMVDDSADQEKIREKYEKARASAEKHYDKLDKRQDKVIERNRNLIDRINEERDARQKVYEIQQKNMDNAVKTVNLQNEIAKAQAEGDLAKAAALKMELKAQQAKTAADARENAIQSREDVKIKAANARITAAETEKKKIAELRDAAIKAIAAREKADLKALAAETKAENERRKGLNKSRQAAYEAAKEARSAGRASNTIFGDIAKRLKQKLFTNPELAMKDSVIRKLRDELIAAGYEPAKVDAAIKTMLKSSSTAAGTFMDGVGAKIYTEVYNNGIAKGLDPREANLAANHAVNEIEAVLTDPNNNFSPEIQAKLGILSAQEGISFVNGNIKITGKVSPLTTKLLSSLESSGVLRRNADGTYSLKGAVNPPTTSMTVTKVTVAEGAARPSVPVMGKVDKWSPAAKHPTISVDAKVRYTYWTTGTGPNQKWWRQAPGQSPESISRGQYIKENKRGGYITGPGTKTSDSILSKLSNGEFVIQAAAVDKYGVAFFDGLNSMQVDDLQNMSSKYNYGVSSPKLANAIGSNSIADTNSSMYNYNISVNVAGTNSSAEEIAQQVMNVIKRRENMIGTVTKI